MARWKPWRCKVCKTTEPPISARGLCEPCAIERMTIFATQVSEREGPAYEAWRAKMVELMPSRADRF